MNNKMKKFEDCRTYAEPLHHLSDSEVTEKALQI